MMSPQEVTNVKFTKPSRGGIQPNSVTLDTRTGFLLMVQTSVS